MEDSAQSLIFRASHLKCDTKEKKELINELKEIQKSFQKFDYNFKPKNYFDFPMGNNDLYSESIKILGKEYLRELKQNEVEIARLELESTTQDVCSIRARATNNSIKYRIIDEYNEEDGPVAGVKSSKDILTFRQLIKLIDKSSWFGGSFFGGCRDANYDDFGENNPEELSHFESMDSRFYPELYQYYKHKNDLWLIEKKIEIIEETCSS